MLLSGCTIDNEVLRFGWPSGITPQAKSLREFWTWSAVAALSMGLLVWGLLFWVVLFHRRKANSPEFPRQTAYNIPLELAYTAFPFIAISTLFFFTVRTENIALEHQPNPDVTVDVTAYQWNWKFGYRDLNLGTGMYDAVDHEAEARAEEGSEIEVVNAQGKTIPGPVHGRAENDLSYLKYSKIETVGSSSEIPIMVVPTHRRIQFEVASADVIHSFWVPEFLFKRDVNPNPEQNHSENTWQVTEIEREGSFVGRCAEMCGTYHAMMNFEVRAVTPEQFDQYIQLRKPVAEGGEALTTSQALERIGESPVATTTKPFDTDRTARVASGEKN